MRPCFGGDEEDRTPDPLRARQMLSQLSYTPILLLSCSFSASSKLNNAETTLADRNNELSFILLRKEVIQPHLPIRLPCYDFTPVINPTFDCVLLR